MRTPGNGMLGAVGRVGRVMRPEMGIRLAASVAAVHLLAGTIALGDLNTGLVAYYPLDGNANDASAYAVHGAVYGGISYVSGVRGQAARLNGSTGYIQIPAHASRSFSTNCFSVAFWFRTTEQDYGYMLDSRASYPERGYGLTIHASAPGVVWGPQNDSQQYPSVQVGPKNNAYQDGNWHMVAGLREPNSIAIYLDGVLVERKAILASLNVDGAFPINVGTRFASANSWDYYTGDLDELRIYSRALSAAEVQELYLMGNTLSISSLQASQRAASGSVDVYYTLTSTNSGTSAVSVEVSTTGGATFNITPSSGSLTGDVGAGIALGSRKLAWDAAQTLPAGFYGNNVKVRVTASGTLGTATWTSGGFTVDLAGLTRSIAVNGRVLHSQTRAALPGAAVTLAGQTTATGADGKFSFPSITLADGSTLTVSKSGYATYSGTVPVQAGIATFTLPSDVLLIPSPGAGKPVVTSILPRFDGIALSGAQLFNDFKATVEWTGHPAQAVEFQVNGGAPVSVPTTTTEATANINMAVGFYGSLTPGANKVTAVAISSDGTRSDPFNLAVSVIPTPTFLGFLSNPSGPLTKIKLHATFPPYAMRVVADHIPVLKEFGGDFAIPVYGEYDFLNGEYALSYQKNLLSKGSDYPPGMKVGEGRFELDVEVSLSGRASRTEGIGWPSTGTVTLSGRREIKVMQFLIADSVGPWTRILDLAIPFGLDVNSVQRVNVYALFDMSGSVTINFNPLPVRFEDVTFEPGIGLKAAYEPDLVVGRFSLYVGGIMTPSIRLYPEPALTRITADMFLGVELEVFGRSVFDEEYTLVTWRWPSSSAVAPILALGVGSDPDPNGNMKQLWVRIKKPKRDTPRNRDFGLEGFAIEQNKSTQPNMGRRRGNGLDAFRAIGGERKAFRKGHEKDPILLEANEISLAQADLIISTNVFTGSQPAMASWTNELMLLYVGDNGFSNTLQCTDIRWTHYDGTNWSTASTIHPNTQAEFAPQVAYDANGDAIAVWERVTDPNLTNADLSAMAEQMEVVWSKWDHTSAQWSVPEALTANSYLDHAPQICGPMSDGTVLALWTANTNNLLMGTNGAGSQVLWAQWNPGGQSWSAPQVLLADLPNRLSQSLSGVSNRAVYAWTRDLDGVLTNANDQQVFYCQYQSGGWSGVSQLTSNTNGNRNVRVAVSGAGDKQGVSEGFESGTMTGLPWTSSGNAAWAAQSSVVNSGRFAAASGTIGNSQTSGMIVTQSCVAGSATFAYKVSSEGGYDHLRFYIDGAQQGAWSGAVGWATNSYAVTAGTHVFEWRYTKDVSYSGGSDKAWVDDISLPMVTPSGISIVWQQGTNLVLSPNFSTSTTIVRSDSQTAGFADCAMTVGPGGNLALLWQEMSQSGSDAHYRVLDPASATWSKDAQLFNDLPLERSFAPVWDDVGNLTVAYNKVQISYTNKTVTLEGGGTVTITNVPQPGRVDLCVTKRELIKDLALNAGDFTVSAENYLPGAAVTLSATLRNAGDLAVSNAAVAFYDGNPTDGGVLITNIAVSGWLEGAATNTVSALWVVPEPATNHVLYAVADPAGAVTEFDESNNQLSLNIGGTDVSVALVSQVAETNGAVRVVAQVQNIGAPSATNSVLGIRRFGDTSAPLATVAVPLLEPGRLAQVALDLPAGTQPEGEALYTLRADESHVIGDVETNNNTTSFAVNLWLDSDGDGTPDAWMMEYFGHSDGQAGDLSRAQDDADGDGMTNLAEYLAGTSPRDAGSYLRITSLAVSGTSGVQVVWGSATNKLYSVERADALAGSSGLTNIAEHILSTPPETSYLDMTATNSAAFFYRIRVE